MTHRRFGWLFVGVILFVVGIAWELHAVKLDGPPRYLQAIPALLVALIGLGMAGCSAFGEDS